MTSPQKEKSARSRAKPRSGPTPDHIWGKGRIRLDTKARCYLGMTEDDVLAWGKAYPACDIDQELSQMIEWCLANPAKGRKSNYQRFITNWLSNEQDKGGSSRGGTDAKQDAAARRRADRRQREYPEPATKAPLL